MLLVDGNELGLGVAVLEHSVQAGDADVVFQASHEIGTADVEYDDESRWKFRYLAVAEVFLALVFDGDGCPRPVGADGDGIRLVAEIERRDRFDKSLMSMTTRRPDGAMKLGLLLIATRA